MDENSLNDDMTALTAQSTDATGDRQVPGLQGVAQTHDLGSSVAGKIDNNVDANRYQLTSKLLQPSRLRSTQ